MPVMPDKAAFVSALLLCVQPLPGVYHAKSFSFSFLLIIQEEESIYKCVRSLHVLHYIYFHLNLTRVLKPFCVCEEIVLFTVQC